ncbi:MAG: DEAD/DEAH box helicase [Lentisphaerae bacterium]|nr:DEAD/DEAH box helicase [Lentisphaerota bacterium]
MGLLQKLARKIVGKSSKSDRAVPASVSSQPAGKPAGEQRSRRSSSSQSSRRGHPPRREQSSDSWAPGEPGSAERPARSEKSGRPDRGPRPPRRDRPSRDGRPNRSGPPPRQRDRGPERGGSHTDIPRPEALDATPWDAASFQVTPEEGKVRFHDVDLPAPLMRAIQELGFEYCTPIQAEVLTKATHSQNISGRAQTGTGKTAAFLITLMADFLHKPIEGERRNGTPRALVIAPTRELVLQIAKDASALGKYSGIRCEAVYGGMDYDKQRRQLDAGPVDIIAATPGRLLDYASKGVVNLRSVEVLVIDEADRMLDMGFIPDVRRIIGQTPRKEQRRTLLFSATLTDDVRRLATQWMTDPVEIEIEPEQVTTDTVEQIVYSVTTRDKFPLLMNLLKDPAFKRVLIFGNRRDRTKRLSERLRRERISCDLLSGAVEQRRRLSILEDFRSGRTRVVVATDVAGRGIHIDDITHVINYEFPYEPEDYVHRIGRTGRVGTEGVAISFACEDESFIIPDIEAYIGRTLPCRVPDEALLPPRQEQRA